MPPANAPIPTTEPTAARGNMSLASVYTLADHAWCAAAATPTIRTAVHMLPASGAKAVGTIRSAMASIAVLRARLTAMLALALLIVPTALAPLAGGMWTARLVVGGAGGAAPGWGGKVYTGAGGMVPRAGG